MNEEKSCFSKDRGSDAHPYEDFLELVERPGRYLGQEFGAQTHPWEGVDCRMVFAFPDTYEVGMSHMGTKILYKLVNSEPDLLMDRCMMPWFDMYQQLRTRELPLVSLEHAKALRDFDVVGFSLQFELTFTNVLAMLDLGGLPVHSKDRDMNTPLVIAGGPAATHPEGLAPFIDAFFIGEAESALPELLRHWMVLKKSGVSRTVALQSLAANFSVYVPELYAVERCPRSEFWVVQKPKESATAPPFPVERSMVPDLDEFPFPSTSPEPIAEAVFDRAGIEIARGCTEGCRFCQAGMIYRPVRERSPKSILKTMTESVANGGYDDLSLTSLSTADYSAIVPLIKEAGNAFEGDRVGLAVSSLRAYGLPDETLDAIREVRAGGLTFAPEAGTQRMRDVINKNISEEDMLLTARRVFEKGWARMKLYFMMGLPTETDEDLKGITRIGGRVRKEGNLHARKRPEVNVSVSVHVPKPHTPFQWCAMDNLDEVRRKQRLLREQAHYERIQLKTHGAKPSYIEGVIARGDRAVAQAVLRAYEKGCIFDGWDEHFRFDLWKEAFEETGVDPELYLRTIPTDARLPWDHIDVGLEDGFLLDEYRRALSGRYSPPCGKPLGGAPGLHKKVTSEDRTSGGHHGNLTDHEADERRLICYDCGVACDLSMMRDERGGFLKELGAIEAPDPFENAWTSDSAKARVAAQLNRPPTRSDLGESVRMRLWYAKSAPAHLVGHRDTMRRIPRILRRAGLRPEYTKGFHPKPKMTFGPTLPLGYLSLSEVIDVHVLSKSLPDQGDILDRLNAASPAGIQFVRASVLDSAERKLSKAVRTVEHVVELEAVNDDLGTADVLCEVRRQIEAVNTAQSWPITVTRKGETLEKDAVKNFEKLSIVKPGEQSELCAPARPGAVLVHVVQNLRPSPSVRPNELALDLVKSLEGQFKARVTRTQITL